MTGLKNRKVNVKIRPLEKGDYIISDECGIERKTVQDFVYTLTRRNLFDQLFRLKEVYSKSLILLEGYLPIVYKFSNIQPAAVWGAMFKLAKSGIAFVNTNSYKESIDFLIVAARQEQFVEKKVPMVHPFKKTETLSDAQVFFMASLPKIGREKATAILKSYGTPRNALANVVGWPKKVHGLGPIISRKARDVLDTPFVE